MTNATTFQQLLDHGKAYHHAGRLAEANASYRQALALQPSNPEALYHVGILAVTLKNYAESLTLLRHAAALAPQAAHIQHALGIALLHANNPAAAEPLLLRAIALAPTNPVYLYDLGVTRTALKKFDEALAAYQQVLALQPNNVFALSNSGTVLAQQFKADEAIALFRRALALQPNSIPLLINLANMLQINARFDEALEIGVRFMAAAPQYLEARFAMSGYLRDSGQVEAALDLHRALDPATLDEYAYRQRLSLLHYHPALTAADILREHTEWANRLMKTLPPLPRPAAFPNDRTPSRRLRIGYVSPDLHSHVVARNLLPLFRHHDHAAFEITAYPLSRRDDEITKEIRSLVDHWHPLADLSTENAAALIRSHQIDILIDLALHTKGNALELFARKPAPLQFTFAGYPGTTGLTAIDYRITDPFLDPPATDEQPLPYSESSVRITSFWCYEGMRADTPVNPLPALTDPIFTFGSLNAGSKVNRSTLQLWSRVLSAVPSSRMIILLGGEKTRARTLALFQDAGITPDRIRFIDRLPSEQYRQQFHAIDLCLDTLPYNGHTTSLDALWMGVPTLTLVGHTVVGRAGFSQLSNLNLPAFITHTPEAFIAAAQKIAADLPALSTVRQTLRARMEGSPLMDGKRFAREIESTYRTAWTTWCHAQ